MNNIIDIKNNALALSIISNRCAWKTPLMPSKSISERL